MDNKINKIRSEISVLRTEMLETEISMHALISCDRDYSSVATKLMAQRAELAGLIAERKVLGDKTPIEPRKLRGSWR